MLDRVSPTPVTARAGFPVTYSFRQRGESGAATPLGSPASNGQTLWRVSCNGLALSVPLRGQFGPEQLRAGPPLMDRLLQAGAPQTPLRTTHAFTMGGTPGTATPVGLQAANGRTLRQVNWNSLTLTVPLTGQFGPEQLRAGIRLKDTLLQLSGPQTSARSTFAHMQGGTSGTSAPPSPPAANGQPPWPWNRVTLDVRLAGQFVPAPLRHDPVVKTQFEQPSAHTGRARTDGPAALPRAQPAASPSPSGPNQRPSQRQTDLNLSSFDLSNGRTTRITQPLHKDYNRDRGGYFTVDRNRRLPDISAMSLAAARDTSSRTVVERLSQQGGSDPRNTGVNRMHQLQLGGDGRQHWTPTSRSTYPDGRSLFHAQQPAGMATDPSRTMKPGDSLQFVAGYRDTMRERWEARGYGAVPGLSGPPHSTVPPQGERYSFGIVSTRKGMRASTISTGPGVQGVRAEAFDPNDARLGVATQTPSSPPRPPRTPRAQAAGRPNPHLHGGPPVQALRQIQQSVRPARIPVPGAPLPMVRNTDRPPNETSLPRRWASERSVGSSDLVAARAALVRDLSTYARSNISPMSGIRRALDADLAAGQQPGSRAVGVLRLPGTLKPVNDQVGREPADRLIGNVMGLPDNLARKTPGFDDLALYQLSAGRFAVEGDPARVRDIPAHWPERLDQVDVSYLADGIRYRPTGFPTLQAATDPSSVRARGALLFAAIDLLDARARSLFGSVLSPIRGQPLLTPERTGTADPPGLRLVDPSATGVQSGPRRAVPTLAQPLREAIAGQSTALRTLGDARQVSRRVV